MMKILKETNTRKKRRLLHAGQPLSCSLLLFIMVSMLLASCNNATKPVRKPGQGNDGNATAVIAPDTEARPVQIKTKRLIEDFIPKGWKVIARSSGDLNGDGISDDAIVIEDTDPDNFRRQDGLGADTLNLNPRTLMVFFKHKNGYQLISQNDQGFIPTANDEDSPCLADPLLQDGDLSIKKGLLCIALNYWLSCGSWYVNSASYKFRYQHNAMELIGFDHTEFHRASGEASNTSINYITRKKSTTSGGNMFDEQKNQEETVWSKIHVKALQRLDDCNAATYGNILGL
ncbi:hypothetical protein [Pedobacter sp. SYP-B3415]|uniref:hypothetical protein n=1 Tax=Pedobacter sp. SYP-B3415 TaxID=2496641 RepID=UPI00101D9E4F|nr:hypothetical protein [Pedobacter sp. SYP-B3415]